jgi:hypothetical protein
MWRVKRLAPTVRIAAGNILEEATERQDHQRAFGAAFTCLGQPEMGGGGSLRQPLSFISHRSCPLPIFKVGGVEPIGHAEHVPCVHKFSDVGVLIIHRDIAVDRCVA